MGFAEAFKWLSRRREKSSPAGTPVAEIKGSENESESKYEMVRAVSDKLPDYRLIIRWVL
jgi:hypothetical protein